MPTLMLSLIFIPIVVFLFVRKAYPRHLWLIFGLTFGLIVYPFLDASTLPLMYMGKLGQALLHISNPLTLFHRWPGKAIYSILYGYAHPNMVYMLWLSAINALVWSAVYGLMGWYVDRNPARNFIHVLILLFAAPFILSGTLLLKGSLELTNRFVNSSNYSEICLQIIDSDDPDSKVWLGVGSFNKGYMRVPAVVGRQICRTVEISKAPFQVILGNPQTPDNQKIALDIPIKGGSKSCIGLSPNFKGASEQGSDWTAQVIGCTP
jgi:hypothetical protein